MKRLVKIQNITVGDEQPLVLIAGPCVIESEGLCEDICGNIKLTAKNLNTPFIFKASYDKANRTSLKSFRGIGLNKGLKILANIKKKFNVPVLSDVHGPEEAKEVSSVVDVLQIPALLSRQTDLLIAAAKTKKTINVKKGQWMSPIDMKHVIEKIESGGNKNILLCERGTSFGYHNLVSDMRSLPILRSFGYPVIYDASHSAQLPAGAYNKSTGSRNDVLILAKAATAVGIDALFLEIHPKPSKALSDSATMIDYAALEKLLPQVLAIHKIV